MTRRFDPILVAGWAEALGPALAAALPEWIDASDAGPDAFLLQLHATGKIDRHVLRRCLFVRGQLRLEADPGATPGPAGAVTHGPFALLGEIGRGGQGTVYIARDLALGRKIAFKVEAPHTDHGRFIREAQITAQLEHPNIVPVHELCRLASGQRAYAMKVIEGRTLAQVVLNAWMRHTKARTVNEARELAERLEYFLKVCDAVAYAHTRGVVHLDLKPDNVMIGPHREVYVMDWGIARLADEAGQGDKGDDEQPRRAQSSATASDTLEREAVGTPMYMSPEQARSETAKIGPPSDQYALGLMLQELVTLQPAVRAPTAELALYHAGQALRAPMEHVRAGLRVNKELVAMVAHATAARPEDRYPSVEALAEDVRSYLRGDEVGALPDDFIRRWSRAILRHRGVLIQYLLLGALIGVAILSVFGLAALWQVNLAQRETIASTAALTAAERRVDAIEARLGRFAELAEAIGAAATIVLSDTITPAGAPPPTAALRYAAVYDAPVSFAAPILLGPTGSPTATPTAERLGLLRDDLRRALIRSGTDGDVSLDEAETWGLLAERGVPVRQIHVVLEDGTHLVYPGAQPAPGGADPRTEPWYQAAARKRFLHWRIQESRPDLAVATVSRSIFGVGTEAFEGVVALEVRLPSSLLETALYRSAWLLGPNGSVVLSTPGAGPVDLVVLGRVSTATSWVGTNGDGDLCASAPLLQLGWVYLGCVDGAASAPRTPAPAR